MWFFPSNLCSVWFFDWLFWLILFDHRLEPNSEQSWQRWTKLGIFPLKAIWEHLISILVCSWLVPSLLFLFHHFLMILLSWIFELPFCRNRMISGSIIGTSRSMGGVGWCGSLKTKKRPLQISCLKMSNMMGFANKRTKSSNWIN